MSTYAVTDGGALIVCWWTGSGQAAQIVARSPAAPLDALGQLAGELSRLSEECCRVYVEPLTQDPLGGEVDGRADLAGLASIITSPELPHADGYISTSYIPAVEFANRAGR